MKRTSKDPFLTALLPANIEAEAIAVLNKTLSGTIRKMDALKKLGADREGRRFDYRIKERPDAWGIDIATICLNKTGRIETNESGLMKKAIFHFSVNLKGCAIMYDRYGPLPLYGTNEKLFETEKFRNNEEMETIFARWAVRNIPDHIGVVMQILDWKPVLPEPEPAAGWKAIDTPVIIARSVPPTTPLISGPRP